MKYQSGFTLVETIAAAVIFGFIVTVFASVFVDTSNLQKKAFNIQQTEENANIILESMAKEIRVGVVPESSNTSCPSAPSNILTFQHETNGAIQYYLDLGSNSIARSVNGVANIINSNAVEFTRLQFCISGAELGDNLGPRITILATIRSKNTQQQSTIDIQTTLSQRFAQD